MPIAKPPASAAHFGQGVSYPLAATSAGRLKLSVGRDCVDEAMAAICQTAPGERVMQPDYGGAVGIHEPVNEPHYMTEAIRQTVLDHEPRVNSDDIQVEVRQVDAVGKVEVSVTYSVAGEANERTLTYPYYAVTSG